MQILTRSLGLSLTLLGLTAGPLLAQGPPDRDGQPPGEAPAEEVTERGVLSRTDGATDGLTLLAPLRSTSTFLLDLDGEVVHTWPSEHTPGHAVYLLDDGSILRTGRVDHERFAGGGQGGRLQRIGWDGEVLWDADLAPAGAGDDDRDFLAHHDVEPLPNGNVLVVAWEHRDPDALFRAGRRFEAIQEDGLWPDMLLELEPRPTAEDPGAYEVVWEWHVWDHLVQDRNESAANHGVVADRPGRLDVNALLTDREETAAERERREELEEEMRGLGYLGGDDDDADDVEGVGERAHLGGADWLHTNSVDYLPGEDLIVLSLRSLSEVWVIDHGTTTAQAATGAGGRRGRGGDVLWRWGNPAVHGGEGPQVLFAQHDARWVHEADQPTLMVFNNGEGRPGDERFSTVEVVRLPALDGRADAAGTHLRTIGDDEDEPSFYSSFISGAQDLPGGNVLICSGAEARLIEVDPTGAVVWEWVSDLPGATGATGGPGRERAPGRGEGRPPRGRDGGRPPFPQPGDRPGRDGPGPGARAGGPGGGPGGDGLFRGTRYPADHPGLDGLTSAGDDEPTAQDG